MKNLKNNELREIEGGISGWVIIGVSALITLVAGLLDGITSKVKCS
jgi:lactobin A/cerein 7B family class IIb bacteriocin